MVLIEGDFQHYNRQQFRMFNLLRSPVWIFDIEQRSMYWANSPAVHIWNAGSLEELLARDFRSDMSDATVSILQDRLQKLTRNEFIHEQWTFYPQGQPVTLDIVCSGVRIEDGRVAMLVEAEMADHKQLVADSTVRRFEILKHLPIAVSQFTMQGELVYQNPHALKIFGSSSSSEESEEDTENQVNRRQSNNRSEETSSSSSSLEAVPSNPAAESVESASESKVDRPSTVVESNIIMHRFVDEELGQKALQTVQEGTDFSIEAQLYTEPPTPEFYCQCGRGTNCPNYQQRWFNVLLRRTRDPVTSEFVILCIARDISDVVRARKETTKAAMKSEFLDVMAHEIRTPLHQIVGHVDLLEDSVLDQEQLESVQQIQSSSSMLMSIINDLLDCSKLEYGQVQIENVTFSLERVVNGCIASIRPQAQKKKIAVSSNIHPDCKPYLLSDPNRLRQILSNLLSNAVKFTDTGSVTVTVAPCTSNNDSFSSESCIIDATPSQRLRFEVTDTGIGIDAKEQDAVFERYRQANSSVARRFGGTGLGLPICKGFVELMNGSIGLNSVVGKGTTFYFELPLKIGHGSRDNSSVTMRPRSIATALGSAIGMKVLVVEDNLVSQKVVQSMLKRLGHTVTLAENGEVALKALSQNRFHVILMDIQMPVMDGVDCTKYIRNVLHMSKEKMPIVGLTAGLQPSNRAYYENEVGMNSCLGKPLPMDALKKVLAVYQPVALEPPNNVPTVYNAPPRAQVPC
jgi:signal transduction histidine kinase/PAS domain-containing protein/ActR/RegA family two-component response regulator